jgi:hypothetical protein
MSPTLGLTAQSPASGPDPAVIVNRAPRPGDRGQSAAIRKDVPMTNRNLSESVVTARSAEEQSGDFTWFAPCRPGASTTLS